MRCTTVRNNLNAYLDGELPTHVLGEMATHLQCCQGCRQAWVRLRQVGTLLQSASAPAVPEDFSQRVLSQARQRTASPRPAVRASFAVIRRWRSVPLAQRAAAAAVLFFGLSTGLFMGWQTAGKRSANASPAPSLRDDPVVVFNLDYLGGDPDGSLPRAYLTLVSADSRPGE